MLDALNLGKDWSRKSMRMLMWLTLTLRVSAPQCSDSRPRVMRTSTTTSARASTTSCKSLLSYKDMTGVVKYTNKSWSCCYNIIHLRFSRSLFYLRGLFVAVAHGGLKWFYYFDCSRHPQTTIFLCPLYDFVFSPRYTKSEAQSAFLSLSTLESTEKR